MRHPVSATGLLGGAIPVLCLSALLLAPPATAGPGSAAEAEPPADADADTAAPVDGTLRAEILVTASLRPDSPMALPASAEVIDAEDLERLQTANVGEALATAVGLHLATSGSPGHTTSAFSRGTNSNHTLVLWNGVPLNGAFEGRFDFAFLPADGVERIEIARGPWSALYGSGLGGVIQVLTGTATGIGAPAGTMRLEAGAHRYQRGSLVGSASTPGGGARASLVGVARRGDGEFPNDFYDADDAQLRLAGKVGAVEKATWGLLWRTNRSQAGLPFDGVVASPRRRNDWSESQLAAPFAVALGTGWTIDALVSRSTADLEFRDPDAFFGTFSRSEGSTTRGRWVLGHARQSSPSWWGAGAEWVREEVDYRDDFSRLERRDRRSGAVFAQTRLATSAWSFEAGVRHDDDENFGGHTSPRLGAVRRLGERGRVYASYGESFRSPSFLDLYYPFYGNPALEPETSQSAELGTAFRLWESAGAGASVDATLVLFRNDIRDLIQGAPPTFEAQNIGRARTAGAELVAEFAHRPAGLSARFTLTRLEAENRSTGARLLRRPRDSASLQGFWGPSSWPASLRLGLVGRWVGARDDIDPATFSTVENPSFLRLDLLASAEPWAGWRLNVRLENAADREYAEVLGFPAPGRAWIGGVSYRFGA